MAIDTSRHSLRDLVRGLRRGDITAPDLLRQARERMDATEARLGAYKTPAGPLADAAARAAHDAFRSGRDGGALQGIPVSVKDIYVFPGLPTFAGSPREIPLSWRPPGPIAASLAGQHATVMGKTHTVEFAFGGSGINRHWKTPVNPWDAQHHRVPGGSSAGAGVSLCQGSALVAFGSDTGGSVRVPASVTGNVGFKPTVHRWSTAGITPLSALFDSPGILTRTVDDAFVAAAEIDRTSPGLTHPLDAYAHRDSVRLRIGVPEHLFWDDCEPGIAEGVRAALAEMERAGHTLVAMAFPEARDTFEIFRQGGTSGAELLAFLQHELPEWIPTLDAFIAARIEATAHLPAVDFLRRKLALETLSMATRARFSGVDVVVSPTVAISPPRMEEFAAWEAYRALSQRMIRNTCVANLLGLSSLTLPVALDARRLPVGLQVMAAGGRDDALFAAGLEMERVLGTGRQRLGDAPLAA